MAQKKVLKWNVYWTILEMNDLYVLFLPCFVRLSVSALDSKQCSEKLHLHIKQSSLRSVPSLCLCWPTEWASISSLRSTENLTRTLSGWEMTWSNDLNIVKLTCNTHQYWINIEYQDRKHHWTEGSLRGSVMLYVMFMDLRPQWGFVISPTTVSRVCCHGELPGRF